MGTQIISKEQAIHGYKMFESDWTCRDKQYSVPGRFYETRADICWVGMHFCPNLADCFDYYDMDMKNHVVEVIGRGEFDQSGNKVCCADLEIIRELTWDEVLEKANFDINNHGRYNAGRGNYGDYNTGDDNIGSRNTGDNNFGCRNTGNYNLGIQNSGQYNIGDYNTGNYCVGHFNSGYFCVGNRISGFCCYNPNAVVCGKDKLLFNKAVSEDVCDEFLAKYFTALEIVFDRVQTAVQEGKPVNPGFWKTDAVSVEFTDSAVFNAEIMDKIICEYAHAYERELNRARKEKERILSKR